jgi:hypothetical protein
MTTKDIGTVDTNVLLAESRNPKANTADNLILSKSFKDILNKFIGKAQSNEVKKSSTSDYIKNKFKIDSAVKWLANYLGINESFLLFIFEKLNIDPKDMADQAKLKEIITKISQYFDLDEDQQKEITERLQGIFQDKNNNV